MYKSSFMVVFKFSVADMFELFQCIKAVLWCFQVFRGWIGDGTAHLKKMGTNKLHIWVNVYPALSEVNHSAWSSAGLSTISPACSSPPAAVTFLFMWPVSFLWAVSSFLNWKWLPQTTPSSISKLHLYPVGQTASFVPSPWSE